MKRLILLLLVGLWLVPGPTQANGRDVVIFAAASLKNALDDALDMYQAPGGHDVVVSYAGTSALARQIEQGAPADIFISANVLWMDALAQADLIRDDTRSVIAGNRLVLVGRADGRADLARPADLPAVLGPDARLAMALTDAVPAGIYGKAALTALGLWADVAPFVVQTDNVRAALRLVALGEAHLGIVYATDALIEPAVTPLAEFPAETHPPVHYPAALTTDSKAQGAADVLRYLQGGAAQAVFARHGFLTGPAE